MTTDNTDWEALARERFAELRRPQCSHCFGAPTKTVTPATRAFVWQGRRATPYVSWVCEDHRAAEADELAVIAAQVLAADIELAVTTDTTETYGSRRRELYAVLDQYQPAYDAIASENRQLLVAIADGKYRPEQATLELARISRLMDAAWAPLGDAHRALRALDQAEDAGQPLPARPAPTAPLAELPRRSALRLALDQATARYHRIVGELAELALVECTVPDTERAAYYAAREDLQTAQAAYYPCGIPGDLALVGV